MKHSRLLSIILLAIFFSGCGVSLPAWGYDSVQAALSREGYTLVNKRTEPASGIDGLVEVVELSMESKRKIGILLRLYQFESEKAAIDASFSIVQSRYKAGRYINSAVNGKVAAVLDVNRRDAAEADDTLEILKRI